MLAGAILLMHSILPHEHHSELDENQHVEDHETASSLLDYIKLAFHLDPGQNHLEEFQVSKQIQAPLVLNMPVEFVYEAVPELMEERVIVLPAYQFNFKTRFKHQTLRFRGPPQLS